jgi:hypothetical protein
MTQTAVGVPEPSWDETIVPTLRKRLQQESRTLTQRMSTISITSSAHEGVDNTTSDHPRLSMSSQRPTQSPIPPEQARTSTDRSRPLRSRTYSQPLAFQNKSAATNPNRLGSPGSPTPVKPTRIPQPTRSPPMQQNGFADHKPQSPSLSTSVYQNSLTPTLPTPSRQPSGILREPAPFDPNSESRSDLYYDADEGAEDPPKASMESEEHPYEHWYRGESSRNGGVGELRVGRRQEMLDIANYGHEVRARKQAYAAQREAQLRAQATERTDPVSRRKRADSVGPESRRGSLYEEDEDMDQIYDSYYGENQDETIDASLDINRSTTPSHIPRPSSRQRTTPTPTQGQASSSRYHHGPPPSAMSTGLGMQRGASEPPPSASRVGATSPVITPDKRGRKNLNMSVESSPASVNSKKMNATAMNRAKKERERKEREKERRSVAHYPVEDFDGDMADAIPSWTQPVKSESSGNWDDVSSLMNTMDRVLIASFIRLYCQPLHARKV